MIAFARQLRGQADIAPNDAGGVTVRLTFPAPEAGPPGGRSAPAPPKTRRKAAA
jgi:hypothetical protein